MKAFHYNFEGKKQIPQRIIEEIWQSKFSDKPMPKVLAFELKYRDFVKSAKAFKESDPERSKLCDAAELKEHGRIILFEDKTAILIPIDNEGSGFIILRRQNPYFDLKHDLTHELTHIYSGNWKLEWLNGNHKF